MKQEKGLHIYANCLILYSQQLVSKSPIAPAWNDEKSIHFTGKTSTSCLIDKSANAAY